MTLQETLHAALGATDRRSALESLTRGVISADPAQGRARVQLALEKLRSAAVCAELRGDITAVLGLVSRRSASDCLL